ncbi:NUDIX hydrolase [Candidatus Woesearchaeota archaeon]|nr:NUDIX hydrolase [Candidatus Woesearchaeota archaeon]
MLFSHPPSDFHPGAHVVSCFVEHDGHILLLHRQDHKPYGNTWGIPAGKVDPGEEYLQAVIREVFEETGIRLYMKNVRLLKTVPDRYPDSDFWYHMFKTRFETRPAVQLNPKEHKEYRWVKPLEALTMPLILDEDTCISMEYGAGRS